MHRRSFTAGVPLPARAIAQPGRCRPRILAPATLLGFCPSRRCSRPRVSRRFHRSDPPAVFPALRPDALWRSMCRRVVRSPFTHSSGSRTDLPQATGRGSWASSPRAVRSADVTARHRRGRCRPGLRLSQVFGRPPSYPRASDSRPRGVGRSGLPVRCFRRDLRRAGLRHTVPFCVYAFRFRTTLAPSATGPPSVTPGPFSDTRADA